jgi:PPOX class probable F420-dependent enzyme
MSATLNEKSKALVARPVLATIVTLGKDGSPQATPLWVEMAGEDISINTAKGRAKANNIERDPRVAISIVDPEDPYNVIAVRGTVVEVTNDGADEQIDRLAKKYMGVDSYPMRQEGEVRLSIRIRIDKILMPAA